MEERLRNRWNSNMRKLTRADKKILLANQRHIEKEARLAKTSIFKLWRWFHKINKVAKKYDIKFVAIKGDELHDYVFKYKKPNEHGELENKDYKPLCRLTPGLWSSPEKYYKTLRENIDNARGHVQLVVFLSVPCVDTNQLKLVGFEDNDGSELPRLIYSADKPKYTKLNPSCYNDWAIFTKEVVL